MAHEPGSGLELMERKLTASFSVEEGDAVGFDPMIIIAIITALLPIIQQCFAPKPANLRVGSLRWLVLRGRVATNIRRETGVSWKASLQLADKVRSLAQSSSDEELQMVIDDCCGHSSSEPSSDVTTDPV